MELQQTGTAFINRLFGATLFNKTSESTTEDNDWEDRKFWSRFKFWMYLLSGYYANASL